MVSSNQYVFQVAIDATKTEVKAAVEELFKVNLKAVNTVVTKGKVKRFRGKLGKRSDVKKAYVTLSQARSSTPALLYKRQARKI